MDRYARLDSDESRLPDGMRRVGYDADTQRYTFEDTDGSYWEGPEGAQYGVLHRAGTARRQPVLPRAEAQSDSRSIKDSLRARRRLIWSRSKRYAGVTVQLGGIYLRSFFSWRWSSRSCFNG
ncbi:hypothetical protein GJ744_010449 [Endocarpon pusillum]|uniref:Uncharacterized protein n=1 Tax=Endocarpon pusillum TaxID=364733 RepID=A0A8H7AE16_9EURO|nr:hypothetical protein GJ744_010449 [Endocarpon pusillum]